MKRREFFGMATAAAVGLTMPFSFYERATYTPRIRYVKQFVISASDWDREHRYDAVAARSDGEEAQLYLELRGRDDQHAREWLASYARRLNMTLIDPNHARYFHMRLSHTVPSEYV